MTVLRMAGWDSLTPAAQLVAFTPVIGLISLIATACSIITRNWRLTALLATVLVVHGALMLPAYLPSDNHRTSSAPLTVLTINAGVGAADAEAITSAVLTHRVDLLVIAELTPELGQRLAATGLSRVLRHSVTAPQPGPMGTGLFCRIRLTERAPVPDTSFTQVRATLHPQGLPAIPVTAVHTFPPLPGSTAQWQHDLKAVATTLQRDGSRALAAGDFNASWDHSAFRSLLSVGRVRDSARQLGAGWLATWPSVIPLVQLDHIVAGNDLTPRAVARLRIANADHLAVIVTFNIQAN